MRRRGLVHAFLKLMLFRRAHAPDGGRTCRLVGARMRAPCRGRMRPRRRRRMRRLPPRLGALFVAHAHVLGPAADIAAQRRCSSTAIVRVPTASSSARSWETSRIAPVNARSASSSASRDSMSRWLVGSSRISTLAPECTSTASDSRRRSPPESPRAASRPPRPRTGTARAARGPCWASGRWRAAAASSTLCPGWPPAPSSSACWER